MGPRHGGGPAPLETRFASLVSHVQDLDKQVARLQKKVAGLEQAAHTSWNATDSGSLYKLFEQRRSWSDAESHCQSFDAHLAVIDSEAKNNFIKGLIEEKPTIDYVWIGVKTKTSSPSTHASFSNFDKENPIDGCAGSRPGTSSSQQVECHRQWIPVQIIRTAEIMSHCQSFDARLAIIDSEAKNNYIKGLFRDKPNVDYVWIGMKTASSQPSSQATFSNFDKQNPVDGCAGEKSM
ncbi:lectin C-type domain protein [Ancylostoma ceylanicum]|uniref:Lectin C-type domain protein n=1 Tax=Ancylostoma ceylanicum TaxID=53326 RepID=A0A0D6MDA9_9BILA|nr:lectin C-type domain protein [Ancylostoma ceylanicum]